jgi:transcription elongation factor Elf1
MTNGRKTKPFGDRSACPSCEEMMPSPVLNEDGSATTTTCPNCGLSRTISVSGTAAPGSDGKLWN